MQVSFDYKEFNLLKEYVRDIERALENMSSDKYSMPTSNSEIELYLNDTSAPNVAGELMDMVAAVERIKRILES